MSIDFLERSFNFPLKSFHFLFLFPSLFFLWIQVLSFPLMSPSVSSYFTVKTAGSAALNPSSCHVFFPFMSCNFPFISVHSFRVHFLSLCFLLFLFVFIFWLSSFHVLFVSFNFPLVISYSPVQNLKVLSWGLPFKKAALFPCLDRRWFVVKTELWQKNALKTQEINKHICCLDMFIHPNSTKTLQKSNFQVTDLDFSCLETSTWNTPQTNSEGKLPTYRLETSNQQT